MRLHGCVGGVAAFAFLLLLAPGRSDAQQLDRERIRVFLDCQTRCDQTHVRTELTWLDWVRDRNDADVHVLVTGQGTGSGGRAYTLAFIGRGAFDGLGDEIDFSTAGDATQDEERQALVSHLSLGLARYAARTPVGRQLRVGPRDGARGPGPAGPGGPGGGDPASPEDDPWNYWVFTVGANGNINGESSQRFSFLNGSVSANRTTEEWKLNLRGSFSRNESRFELTDGTVTSLREDWNTSGLLVKSLGPHWSAGATTSVGSSTFLNQDLHWSAEAGVEYNLFPYSEATRREFTLQYTVGARGFEYEEETLYGETEEVRPIHAAVAALDLTQPWGQVDFRVTASQYLHDTGFYSLNFFTSTNIRLVRGLSFRVTGSYSRVRDQLYIPGGDLTDEEILLRQQALSTDYRYFVSFGVNYRFGSIFNNVVNPRFGSGGGQFFF